jgi:F-type H+-transporting ATPase subunit epsilon
VPGKLTLDIVTVEKTVFSESDIDIVVAPGIEGELGILPMHAPLMTILKPGELLFRRGAEEEYLIVTGGFLEVRDDRVVILADAAERADEVDIARAEAARQKAREAMEHREGEVDLAATEAALARAVARLRFAERRRRRSGGGPPPSPFGT